MFLRSTLGEMQLCIAELAVKLAIEELCGSNIFGNYEAINTYLVDTI